MVDIAPAGLDDALVESLAFGESEYVEVPASERSEAVLGVDVEAADSTVYSVFAAGYVIPEDAPC